jgi:ABC-type multidrug transport system ATPase subunit
MATDILSIQTEQLSKRFHRDWIFRGFTYQFASGQAYAITGPNGSGKSTLLQILAGYLPPTDGKLYLQHNGTTIGPENFYKYIALAAPYLELIEEYTLLELIRFHHQFKPRQEGLTERRLIELMYLERSSNKLVRNFSSGMKQRLKLGLALYSQSDILMLDEPTSNMDDRGISWYHEHIAAATTNKVVLICSNQAYEWNFCQHQIQITDYQK